MEFIHETKKMCPAKINENRRMETLMFNFKLKIEFKNKKREKVDENNRKNCLSDLNTRYSKHFHIQCNHCVWKNIKKKNKFNCYECVCGKLGKMILQE